MRLQHGSAHRDVSAGCSNVEGSDMRSGHEHLDLGVVPLVTALTLAGQAGTILQQHTRSFQMTV